MDKKYLPAIIIGAVAVFLIFRLRGTGQGPQVYNALVPSGGGQLPDSRDPARISAFNSLASLGAAQIRADIDRGNLALGGQRLEYQRELGLAQLGQQERVAQIQQAGILERLRLELADREYDRQLQARAIEQTANLAASNQAWSGASNFLGALLAGLRSGQQGGARSGGMSGGSGGYGTPPINPNRGAMPASTAARIAAYNRVMDWINRNRVNPDAPIVDPNFALLDFDPSLYYREIDNSLLSGGGGLWDWGFWDWGFDGLGNGGGGGGYSDDPIFTFDDYLYA